ncbi:hypothetical protein GCK32_022590 [Trichostrongylus colubriformis]|uniref:Uncharacterized protein n=1 Tax=Trichostrongylus colubriformis TaxID=6319 RepID=A0AAN8IF66_TRICO
MNGVRIYLVPDRDHVKGYNTTWFVPPRFDRQRTR